MVSVLIAAVLIQSTPEVVLVGDVKICTGSPEGIFPKEWYVDEPKPTVVALNPTERQRCIRLAGKMLRRYPRQFLKDNLGTIFFVRSMSFYGQPYGGTSSRDALYICDDGLPEGCTDKYLTQALHHEFAHILLTKFRKKFDHAKWIETLPKGFSYLGSGLDAIKTAQTDLDYASKLNRLGFVNQYAESNWEEDFTVTADAMFADGQNFWKVVNRYPKLKSKVKIATDFYHSLDPWFSEKTFRDGMEFDPLRRN